MSSAARARAVVAWIAFVAYCAVVMAYQPLLDMTVVELPFFRATAFDVLAALALVIGMPELLRRATGREAGTGRRVSRFVLAYLIFQVMVVLPVAMLGGSASFGTVIRTLSLRFAWILFPLVLAIGEDDRARRVARSAPVVGAIVLAIAGLYLFATTGGGFYYEAGSVRFRVLWGGASLLFGWPFVMAAAGTGRWRRAGSLLVVALIGLGLTNHRSGWIAFIVAGAWCLFMSGRIRRTVTWVVPGALVALIVYLSWGAQLGDVLGFTFTRLLDITSGNGADRLMRWGLAWDFFLTHPINDMVWSWRYYNVDLPAPYGPHNFLLEIGVTEGLAGLAFYGGLFWTVLRDAWRHAKSDYEVRWLVGYVILHLVFSAVNATMYSLASMPLLVGAIGLLVGRCVELRRLEASGERRPGERP